MHHAKTKYYTEGLTWVLPYLGLPINLPKELRGNACMPYSVNSTHCTINKLGCLHFSSFSLLLNAAYKYPCILFTNISANILLCHNIILHVEFLDQVPEHFYGFGSKLSVSCLPDGLASICPPIVCNKVLNYFNLC